MADEDARPIIIRRKVVKGGGHHGGAWKVAYADFVTAMMAFFLLMWLLNATTEDQKKGLADYFSPTIAIHKTSGGGDGPLGGSSVTAEVTMPQEGKGSSAQYSSANKQAKGDSGLETSDERKKQESTDLEGIAEALLAKGGESKVADELLRHVRTRVTDEGLIFEIHDLPGRPLFDVDSADPTEEMRMLMVMVADVIALAENPIAVDNHLAQSFINRPASPGWDLSSDRALVARRLIADTGLDPSRFARVSGEADRKPMWDDPTDIRNRRTEIVLLRLTGD